MFERILFEPPSRTQTEQLARKILDYGLMNRRGSEPTVIHIPEVAVRFRESRRNVRQALERLEEQGTVERTDSKDHWKLTSRECSPIRAVYNPPRVSASSVKTPLNPPPGWVELQNRAHRAKDAEEFSAIIDEMNRLLSAHEKAAGEGNEVPTHEPDKKPFSQQDQE